CLCRLGDSKRALAFGERQAIDAPTLGQLAYDALAADCADLARELAGRALRLDPDEPQALHVQARLAEVDGHLNVALRVWERVARLTPDWHVPHENLARLACAAGEGSRALTLADQALAAGGHVCPWAYGVRAQALCLLGDPAGAADDAARAWELAAP